MNWPFNRFKITQAVPAFATREPRPSETTDSSFASHSLVAMGAPRENSPACNQDSAEQSPLRSYTAFYPSRL